MKKFASLLLAVMMIVGMLPLSAIPAFAEDKVTEYYALDVSEGAYIDTGFKPTSNTRVVMDAVVTMDGGWANLFGVYREGSHFYVNNALGHFGAGFGSTVDWVTPFAFARRKIELDRNVFKLDGEIKYTFPSADFQCSDPMYLFALNHYGNIQFQGGQHIRFYSCQIYNNGNMVFDFVPAGKGGTYGLYDKKSGAFYEFNDDSYVTAVNGPDDTTELPATAGKILTSGTYVVSKDTTIKASNGQSALTVSGFVTIIIKEGVTLTVKGGNAIEKTGGGAGIEVPDGSALTIAGGGTLNATGGNASKGANGENGIKGVAYDEDDEYVYDEYGNYIRNPHYDDDDWGYTGAGGKGGYGGGGAGAGIGGRGGKGGSGGKGGAGVDMELEAWTYLSGLNGESGKSGTAGDGCGNVSIYDSVTRNISGGKADANPSSGGAVGNSRIFIGTFYDYPVFGGGGGGGGGNGYPAPGIGSGGAGGGGGGGGGSGCMANFFEAKAAAARGNGYGGKGGVGYNGAGGEGSHGDDYNLDIAVYPGSGGNGGEAGGGAGTEKANIIPTVKLPAPNTLVYNGKEQEGVTFSFGNITGNKATDAGEYTATLTPYEGYYWQDGTTDEKTVTWSIAKCPISLPKTSYCYTGMVITVFAATDLYTVENGSATDKGDHTAKLSLKYPKNYKWENSDDESIFVNYSFHEFTDDGSGKCEYCGGTVKYYYGEFPYLERRVTDNNKVITETKTRPAVRHISPDDGVWGVDWETSWYIVDSNIEMTNRPQVKGTVNIILQNGVTLTANKGINLELDNTLNIYAQSDDESIMGKLVVNTSGVTAIGGRNGGNGENGGYGRNGGNGINGGNINFYGGKVSLKTSGAPCIGGGNGGDGGDGRNGQQSISAESGGYGGNGGNCGAIYFYGGRILLESSNAVCIGGGRGGNGGDGGYRYAVRYNFPGGGGSGGNGGDGGSVHFIAGSIQLKNTNSYCLGGGNGGNGGEGQSGNARDEVPAAGGGNGGNGGGSSRAYFRGGDAFLESKRTAFIGGGSGGSGGEGGYFGRYGEGRRGDGGKPGSFTANQNLIVSGQPVIKAGTSAQDAKDFTEYKNQPYLSVHYHTWEQYDTSSHKCSVCGKTQAHTDDGTGVCTVCGGKVVITVPGKAAKCEEPGYHAYYRCGTKYYKDQKCTQEITDIDNWLKTEGRIEASGHSGEWKVTTAPSCTRKGEESLICKVCGEALETRTVKALGHTPFDAWTVLSAATCTNVGFEVLKCEVCGEQLDTRVIPATGHTYENGICSVCGYECETGDDEPTGLGSVLSDGNWWIIIAVAVLALGGVAALVIVKKKKKPAVASGESKDEE